MRRPRPSDGVIDFRHSASMTAKEIGARGLFDVLDLFGWVERLHGDDRLSRKLNRRLTSILSSITLIPLFDKWCQCRVAPSIVARCEAQLFALSLPRFALRARLKGDRPSFVNIRRLGSMTATTRPWSVPTGPTQWKHANRVYELDQWAFRWEPPNSVITKGSCIADSILAPPTEVHLPNREPIPVTILSVDIASAYGEDKPFAGTPYLRHVRLVGGGLCAQAVCFMATILLHKHTTAVHGLGEITCLVRERPIMTQVKLSGLQLPEMQQYLEKVNLHAIRQVSNPDTRGLELEKEQFSIAGAIAAYVRSGMPVILALDMGRMNGYGSNRCPGPARRRSIYYSNGIPKRLLKIRPVTTPSTHAVLVVGCEKSSNTAHFILNDSATYPFLTVTIKQIAEALAYKNSNDMESLTQLHFLPVTSAAARVPLLKSTENGVMLEGVFDEALNYWVAAMFKCPDPLTKEFVCNGIRHPSTADFRLTPWCDMRNAIASFHETYARMPDHASHLLEKGFDAVSCPPKRWVWVQAQIENVISTPGITGLLIWDAQEPENQKGRLVPRLLTGWRFRQGCRRIPVAWCKEVPDDAGDAGTKKQKIAAPDKKPEASVITSFSTLGIEESLKLWISETAPPVCDLYCFMQSDAERLIPAPVTVMARTPKFVLRTVKNVVRRIFPIKPWYQSPLHAGLELDFHRTLGVRLPIITTVERLAAVRNIKPIVRKLDRLLSARARDGNPRFLAVATYVPEISNADKNISDLGTRALCNLVEILGELNNIYHYSIQVMEVVGGSRINGVWPVQAVDIPNRKDRAFMANISETAAAAERLLRNLVPVMALCHKRNIRLALEVEPGPYCIVNKAGVEEILTRLENPIALDDLMPSHFFGKTPPEEFRKLNFNLDLNGKTPTEVFGTLGFNLDMAHWTLAGYTAAEAMAKPTLVKRIVHAHTSDHGKGHFGDVELGTLLGSAAELENWLGLVALCMKRSVNTVFSGTVAVELEATYSTSPVLNSVVTLQRATDLVWLNI